MNTYYVYIMTNRSRTLYVGVTNDLECRVRQHKLKRTPGFTARYNVTQLAFYDSFANVWEAIEAEKRIKGWTRIKKLQLVETQNPGWIDIAADWFDELKPAASKAVCAPVRRWEERVRETRRPGAIDERSFGVPQDDIAANVGPPSRARTGFARESHTPADRDNAQ